MRTRLSIIRFSYLLTLANRNFKKSLFAINLAIFLAIFAASAAIISLWFENKIADEENFQLTETRYIKGVTRFINTSDVMLNSAIKAEHERSVFSFYNFFLFHSNMGSKIIDEARDLKFKSFYSLWPDIVEIQDPIDDDEFTFLMVIEAMKVAYIENRKSYNIEPNEDTLKLLDDLIVNEKLYKKKYNEIKENIKKDEQFIPLEPKIMFYDGLDSEAKAKHNEMLKKYENYNNFALNYERHTIRIFQITKEVLSEIVFLINQDINYSLQQVKKYSKMETRIILLAFVLQLIVFVIIQFFEVSATASELRKGRKK